MDACDDIGFHCLLSCSSGHALEKTDGYLRISCYSSAIEKIRVPYHLLSIHSKNIVRKYGSIERSETDVVTNEFLTD